LPADELSVAAEKMSREREIVIQRFLELGPREQFAAYRAMRDYLGAKITLVKRDDAVQERAESLEAFKQVAAHLGLAADAAPTPAQFDAACRELDLGWNRSRVKRAWGRWRFGKEAFLGDDHDTAVRRDLHHSVGGRRRHHEAPERAIRLWLKTKPVDRGWRAYTAWAKEYNANLTAGELPVTLHAHHLARKLGTGWKDAVRSVAGEISGGEVQPVRKRKIEMFCRGPHDLVALGQVAAILGCTDTYASKQAAAKRFPSAVIDLPNGRLWVRQDITAYAANKAFPERTVNELRDVYFTLADAVNATGPQTVPSHLPRRDCLRWPSSGGVAFPSRSSDSAASGFGSVQMLNPGRLDLAKPVSANRSNSEKTLHTASPVRLTGACRR
jgi:hypothetical protein